MTRERVLSVVLRCAFALVTPLAAAHVFGCVDSERPQDAPSSRTTAIDVSFPDVTAFDVAEADGAVHVLLGSAAGSDESPIFALSYSRSDDGGATWTRRVTVPTAHAPPTRMHRGDDPQVAARGDHVMALWTAKGDGPFGIGPLACALSDDGGTTWRPGPAPSAEALPVPPGGWKPAGAEAMKSIKPSSSTPAGAAHAHSGHGGAGATRGKSPAASTGPGYRFPATVAGPDGFHAVWIHAAGDERSLRHARLDFGADRWSPASVVDEKICACCWNELKVAPDGAVYALYRDQDPSDMSLAVSRDGGHSWSDEGHAGDFGWHFDGCPHVGGGLALADRGGVLATVWTGDAGSAGAYVVTKNGNDWSTPAPLMAHGTLGRNTDVARAFTTGSAAVVWDQLAGESQAVFLATSSDDGKNWSAPQRLSAPEPNATYPRVVPAGGGFLVLWTEFAEAGKPALRGRAITPSPEGAGNRH